MPREHQRANIPLGVILEMSSGRQEARVGDLSMGGCFVDTIVSAQMGERINLKLLASNTETLEIVGEVIYHLPGFGFGVHFINMSNENQNQLEQIILARGGNPWKGDDV
jgi:hypothetical protein